MNINQLIEASEDEIRAAKEAKEARKTEALEKLLSEMKEFLGEFYTFLEDRYQKTGEKYIYKWETNNEDIPIRIFYTLPAMPEEELAPIVIKWGPHSMSAPNYYDYQQKFYTGNNHYADLKSALRAAREAYPKYLEESKKEAMKSFKSALPSWREGSSEEVALKVLEAHVKLHPDLEEESRAHYAEWKEARESEIRRKEEYRRDEELKEAKDALLKTIRIEYVSRLAEWMKERDEIIENNKEIASAIQDEADSNTYVVYKLTYALMASYEEDGEVYREISTRSAWTLYQQADPFGFWDIDGKNVAVYNPVTLEMRIVKPSEGILAKAVAPAGIDLYFRPETPDEEIEKAIAGIEPLPEEPARPEELKIEYYRNESQYMREARELLSGESEPDEVPF